MCGAPAPGSGLGGRGRCCVRSEPGTDRHRSRSGRATPACAEVGRKTILGQESSRLGEALAPCCVPIEDCPQSSGLVPAFSSPTAFVSQVPRSQSGVRPPRHGHVTSTSPTVGTPAVAIFSLDLNIRLLLVVHLHLISISKEHYMYTFCNLN